MKKTHLTSKPSVKWVLLTLLLSVITQTQAQNVSYKVVYDDPIDVKNLFIVLSPFACDVNAIGNVANIGFIAQGNYNLGNRLAFEASFTRAYLDVMARKNKKVTGTDKLLTPHTHIEGGATFFFRSKVRKKDTKVKLTSTQSGYSYITIPVNMHSQIGVRGGLFYYNYAIAAEGKAYFTGTNANTGQDTALAISDYQDIKTNMNVGGGYAGLIRRKTRDVCIQATGYGQKTVSKITEVYLDVVLAAMVKYTDVVVLQKSAGSKNGIPTPYSLGATKNNLIGWRFGWQYIAPKTVGWQARLEVGQKPGWAVSSGFYLTASWALTIGIDAKAKKKDDKPKAEQ